MLRRVYKAPMRWLFILLAVSGCSSYADRVAATCGRLGAPRGSAYYWSCVQQQVDVDQRDRAAWGGVTMAGAGLLSGPRRADVYVWGR